MKNWLEKIRWRVPRILSHQNKRAVDFIICGTQKGGTSALSCYLDDHPEIHIAPRKEVHFFDDERLFKMNPNYSKYHAYFAPKSSHKILGEATPIYMYWQQAPRRMWEYNPSLKLIVILRNPIDRAYSHWNMERSRNTENSPFLEAISLEKERCKEALPYQHRIYSYVDRGFYLKQLKEIWSYFPKDQVLVFKNEDLKQTPQKILQEIYNFLGVSYFEAPEEKDVYIYSYQSKMSEKERQYLCSIFEDEIHSLEQKLGWDCSDWLAKSDK